MTGQEFNNRTFIEKNNFEVFNYVLLPKQTTPKNNCISKTDNSVFYIYFYCIEKSSIMLCHSHHYSLQDPVDRHVGDQH